LRPAALYGGDDLVLGDTIDDPAMRLEIGFQHVDRRAGFALLLEIVHPHRPAPVPRTPRPIKL